MTGITTYLSMLTLNGLNFPIKHILVDWIKKQDSTICCLQEIHLIGKYKYRHKVKVWKMIFQAKGTPKQKGVAILIYDKSDFKSKLSIRLLTRLIVI
jgi:exonuclease III